MREIEQSIHELSESCLSKWTLKISVFVEDLGCGGSTGQWQSR